ncbi:sensor domain-containing diguanylate cyclase [Aliidiomarina halalkaliphila]|uniref:diguanylate cyclase n=1 Tax=Aliidiomarina halalkaliphila TaxID=2593535 RepID=A0A552X382_9GAMM|nr:sensor domain-containing diguanylate cyclase [Aliidiomarina halalkaliphila]TRW49508.1 sensor domain-containing diguanylate cyclase [Aliidiomarina halalkaliphila]
MELHESIKQGQGFSVAARDVLTFLQTRFDFALWMVTRVEGDNWIVLHAEDSGYGIDVGRVMCWADSYCAKMVRGEGPQIAPDAQQVPAYAEAKINQLIPIRAYLGIPLTQEDGTVFGTLCAVDAQPKHPDLAKDTDLLALMGRLLSSVLQFELALEKQQRAQERLEFQAQTDLMTGIFNRNAWDTMLEREENRCRRFGHGAGVVVVDLDRLKETNDTHGHPAGDKLLKRTAQCLQEVSRKTDIVARIGGDEFGIIAVETDAVGLEQFGQRVRRQLCNAGIAASVGVAKRESEVKGLQHAWEQADQAMFAEKRATQRCSAG